MVCRGVGRANVGPGWGPEGVQDFRAALGHRLRLVNLSVQLVSWGPPTRGRRDPLPAHVTPPPPPGGEAPKWFHPLF